MRPTRPTTNAERTVLRWLLIAGSVVTLAYLGSRWWQKARACTAHCVAQESAGGTLRLGGHSRISLETKCECAEKKAAVVSSAGE